MIFGLATAVVAWPIVIRRTHCERGLSAIASELTKYTSASEKYEQSDGIG